MEGRIYKGKRVTVGEMVDVVVFSSVALRCLGEEEEGVGSFEQPTRPDWIFPFLTGPWKGRRAGGERAREGAWLSPLILAAKTNPRIGKSQYWPLATTGKVDTYHHGDSALLAT